jgi:hypothetical protein
MIFLRKELLGQWYTTIIPALGRLRQKDGKFEVSLGNL